MTELDLTEESVQENIREFHLGDIFTLSDYETARNWAVENGYTIQEMTSDDDTMRQFQIVTCPEEPELTYAEKRAREYPAIPDQLDMIYWDKVNNTNIWQETIAAVKAKYPKPE